MKSFNIMTAWKPDYATFRQYKTASSSTIFNLSSMITPISQTRLEKKLHLMYETCTPETYCIMLLWQCRWHSCALDLLNALSDTCGKL